MNKRVYIFAPQRTQARITFDLLGYDFRSVEMVPLHPWQQVTQERLLGLDLRGLPMYFVVDVIDRMLEPNSEERRSYRRLRDHLVLQGAQLLDINFDALVRRVKP